MFTRINSCMLSSGLACALLLSSPEFAGLQTPIFDGLSGIQLPARTDNSDTGETRPDTRPLPGADQTARYLPHLQGKRIGLVVNQTSRVGEQHLVDFLRQQDRRDLQIQRIFAPEHGFRGTADAGAQLQDGRDPQTGLEVRSLYGQYKKPPQAWLQDLDIIVFDIQDVGVRFYTYISTLHYVLEAAAEAGVPVLILDRPNPNGHYIDGPILEAQWRSFVGMHPIPLVHGMSVGELALMMRGEQWLKLPQGVAAPEIEIIPVQNYRREQTATTPYVLPVKPSPNLPNAHAIALYPSLGLFEGTIVSVGRGTVAPFEIIGLPDPRGGDFAFTPIARPGAQYPPYLGQACWGQDLRQENLQGLSLRWLLHYFRLYQELPTTSLARQKPFFNPFFDKLAGTARLRQQIERGLSEAAIRQSWQADLERFRQQRQAYLLY